MENLEVSFDKKTSLKEVLVEYTLDQTQFSSYHGIPNIFRARNNITRLIWLVFILASTFVCFYLTAVSIVSFLDYDVTTQIIIIPENPFSFPQVSFNFENNRFHQLF
jgi:hypothetical protein